MSIHERADWPEVRWDWAALHQPLTTVRYRQGVHLGRMEVLGFPLRDDAMHEEN